MRWHFEPRPGGHPVEDDDDGTPPALLGLPPALRELHGGRLLDPSRAPRVDGYPVPQPTVYRASTLLVPGDLLENPDVLRMHNDVLGLIGMQLQPADGGHGDEADGGAGDEADADRGDREVLRALRLLPRPAVLVPVPGYPRPVEVDAWSALQTLRAATVPDGREPPAGRDGPAAAPQLLDKVQIDRIELEHLLTSSAITGSPAGEWGGGLSGGPGSGGASGPGPTDSYVFSGGDSRTPVAVLLDPPARQDDARCAADCGRRPVIAVLDSGVRTHRWLGVSPKPGGGYTTAPDGFVAVDDKIQAAIRRESRRARDAGDHGRRVIEDAADGPVADNPLLGELNAALGHGTFIAGIVRQVAPDARVLAIRVMHSDDVLYEGDIICALRHLARRIARAEQGDLAAQVDVVSLSFGYFSESPHDRVMTSGLWQVIEILLSLGVTVVAAAGNYATRRRFYPAAFALQDVPGGQSPVMSVGALNLNGTKAVFSNDGRWVTAWAPGSHVVSTFPTDVAASRTPELRIPVNRTAPGQWPPNREALDPNDYSAGFADWSGTSFAAPYAAALIANRLLTGAAAAGLRLDTAGDAERRHRAVAALLSLPRELE